MAMIPVAEEKVIEPKTHQDLLFPYTDIGLQVEDRILYVAKSILMDKSLVFKKMFESDFQEKDMKVIQLPGKKVEDMEVFLKCLCPFIDNPVTDDNVIQILPLAVEYDAKEILAKCEKIIRDHCEKYSRLLHSMKRDDAVMDIRKILDYLITCEKFNLDESVFLAVADVASYIESARLETLEDYTSLSDKTKLAIARKRLKAFEEMHSDYRNYGERSTSSSLDFLFQVRL